MVISPLNNRSVGQPIRRINFHKDLEEVADLIEESFALQHDADGQSFIREMRQTAREMRLWGWMGEWQAMQEEPARGFVWVESGHVVGNISLLTFSHLKQRYYLIANVAVKQAYRRRGIARALTLHTLNYLLKRGITNIWLLVNADNQAAVHLYHSLGFQEFCRRTTWQYSAHQKQLSNDLLDAELHLRRRQRKEDALQLKWLDLMHPASIQWHLPVSFENFKCGVIWDASRWGEALKLRHWVLETDGEPLGFLTWQRAETHADNLWLAVSPKADSTAVIQELLAYSLPKIKSQKPLSLDLSAGLGDEGLLNYGFEFRRTLIWMKYMQ